MRRREFITFLAGAAAIWPHPARTQQQAMPVVAVVNLGSTEANLRFANAFSKSLHESGWVEGQNVTVEYHWLDGQFDRLSAVI
jgi:putative tryptophan/tyrosine transport system substrate-binding protein